ncbi:MAG: hypothetical protein J1F65_04920 [Clostridiales bacterium]|nr:hypothetical protein [Clostridiales bacterium]
MIETIIAIVVVAVAVVATVIFLLFYFGLVNSYHPNKKAKQGDIKVACVGDSITYGCMVANRNKNNYPAVLNELLGSDYCVANFGYTDRTAIKTANRPYTVEKLYQQSLDFRPEIVVILLGSNDSKEMNWDKEKYVNDYGEIIDSYLNLDSAPKVYLLVPPPVFEKGKKVLYGLRKNVIDGEIYQAAIQLAQTKQIPYIDLHEIFKDKRHLFADGVHPNAKGCKLIAQEVYNALMS